MCIYIYIHYVWCILKGFVWSIPHFQTNTCFLAMSQNPGTIGTHSHSWCSWMLIPPVMLLTWPIHIWGFPEMGAPHTIIHLNKMFHQKNHPALGPNPHENQKNSCLPLYHWDIPRCLALISAFWRSFSNTLIRSRQSSPQSQTWSQKMLGMPGMASLSVLWWL